MIKLFVNNKKNLITIIVLLCLSLVSCTPKDTHVHEFINGLCNCGETNQNYMEEKYEVTFVDYDGTIIKQVELSKDEKVIPPANPTREGYHIGTKIIQKQLQIYKLWLYMKK